MCTIVATWGNDMRKLLIGLAAIVVLVCGVAGTYLYHLFEERRLEETLALQERSLALTEAILQTGAKPDDWSNRIFLPERALRGLVSGLNGIERVVRLGDKDPEGHYDGAVIVRVEEAVLSTNDGSFHAKLSLSAHYQADKKTSWWAGTTAFAELDTMLLPLPDKDDKGRNAIRLHLVPYAVKPKFNWGNLSLSSGDLLAELIADGAFTGWGKELVIPGPSIVSDLELDIGKANSSHNKFEVSGGYDLAIKINRDKLHRSIAAEIPVSTTNGIWMLGGKTIDEVFSHLAETKETTSEALERRRKSVSDRLRPFRDDRDLVYVRIHNTPILEMASELRQATTGSISSSNASGEIAHPALLKDDLLGEVSLVVTPRGPSFLSGLFDVQPPDIKWVPGVGLQTALRVDASLKVELHTHTNAAFVGGGFGNDIDLHAKTSLDLPVSIKVAKQTVAAGSAIVLIPELACRRITIGVTPSAPSDIAANAWLTIHQLRIDVERNIGGGKQAPSILISSLPTFYPFGKNEEPRPDEREYTNFGRRGVEVAWDPKDVVVGADYLELSAGYSIVPKTGDAGPVSKEQFDAFKTALNEAVPAIACEPDDNFILKSWNVTLLDKNLLAKAIMDAVRAGQHVAEETKKELTKLYERPFDSLKDLPDNAWREGTKGVQGAVDNAKAAADAAAKAAADLAKGIADAAQKAKDDLERSDLNPGNWHW
ncbi:hypothetical protein K6M90_29460 [Rhizobium sp. 9T]|uniref:Uncharacterized protein n=4 Tax=Rhizobium TaxID=379 RepID=A0A1L5PB53_RHIET|nr:hypothetical protein AM571_PB00035 [Rhizobium etli 8C-3]EGE55264.1 hypothetical protein RHECNPAF_97002 [Rhizobium etli CNPAF512]MBY4611749.1 hypothetical protein [Rhizobium croatiense]MBY4618131.1 hypothetical protein [Rhizobium redzepovicii]MVO97362.1 hypothetical protein [Rhizobium leguminosarum bv. phaseoli]